MKRKNDNSQYVVGVLEKAVKVGACAHHYEDSRIFVQLPQVKIEN
ncbi:hypothetical protein [Thermococcus piezophilus]|nr:hypothetical protein [Thermococcus piezophilus]